MLGGCEVKRSVVVLSLCKKIIGPKWDTQNRWLILFLFDFSPWSLPMTIFNVNQKGGGRDVSMYHISYRLASQSKRQTTQSPGESSKSCPWIMNHESAIANRYSEQSDSSFSGVRDKRPKYTQHALRAPKLINQGYCTRDESTRYNTIISELYIEQQAAALLVCFWEKSKNTSLSSKFFSLK